TLKSMLEAKELDVVVTFEPGGTELGNRIRSLLLDYDGNVYNRAEMMLFGASRAQHVQEIIEPALNRGAVVLCDRFADSSIAYQGYGRGINIESIKAINNFATGGLYPDICFLLDLPVEIGLARHSDKDRISSEQIDFHKRVRDGFLSIANDNLDKYIILSAEEDALQLAKKAYNVLVSKLAESGIIDI
ncbi:MAG: dTMP kinase, partial [Armatimonadota bacterium]